MYFFSVFCYFLLGVVLLIRFQFSFVNLIRWFVCDEHVVHSISNVDNKNAERDSKAQIPVRSTDDHVRCIHTMHSLIPWYRYTLVTVTFFAIPKLFIRGLVRTQKTTLKPRL